MMRCSIVNERVLGEVKFAKQEWFLNWIHL